jgi:hypothetical protein
MQGCLATSSWKGLRLKYLDSSHLVLVIVFNAALAKKCFCLNRIGLLDSTALISKILRWRFYFMPSALPSCRALGAPL